jgi:hypothetical protein
VGTTDRCGTGARSTSSRGASPCSGLAIDPDYAPLKQLRQANVDMEVFIVERV